MRKIKLECERAILALMRGAAEQRDAARAAGEGGAEDCASIRLNALGDALDAVRTAFKHERKQKETA